MDHAAVLAAFDAQIRRDAPPEGPGVRVERLGRVVRRTGRPADWNGVSWSALTAEDADAEIAAQRAHFAALGLDAEWKLYGHDTPHDLGARLSAAGFAAEPAETVMVAEAADVAAADLPLPDGVRLVPVTDDAGVAALADVHAAAFGAGSAGLAARIASRLAASLREAPETVAAVLVMAGERPVCAARMEFAPGTDFATLWGGGTVPGRRGRGHFRATVVHRARLAAARGYRYLQVDAADTSRPILARMGFTALTTTTPYVLPATPAGPAGRP